MQRTTLFLALALGFSSATPSFAAMEISESGRGQVLLFPYYTVNGGNSTLLSLVNHTDEVKALKIRFREAMNGRDVLDFNIYLPPHGNWRGGIVADDASGPARLMADSTVCTTPAIPQGGVPFRNFAYVGSRQDDGPDSLDRTREGFIEVIEMGVVVDDADVTGPELPMPDLATNRSGVDNQPGDGNRQFASNARRPGDDIVANCNSLIESWASGSWASNPGKDIDEPTGGISGMASIVDVASGVSYSQPATAIDGFFTVANSASLHTAPGAIEPTLASAQTRAQGAVEVAGGAAMVSRWKAGTPDAISFLLMAKNIANRFETGGLADAESEWVVTFPTKHLHIDAPASARRPFTDASDDSPEDTAIVGNTNDASVFDPDGSCEPIGIVARAPSGFDVNPGGTCLAGDAACEEHLHPHLCFQSNVLTFNQNQNVGAGQSAVFGSRRVAKNVDLVHGSGADVDSGHAEMRLGGDESFMLSEPDAAMRTRSSGLPAIGFWAGRFINSSAQPGVLANYAVTAPHTAEKKLDRVAE